MPKPRARAPLVPASYQERHLPAARQEHFRANHLHSRFFLYPNVLHSVYGSPVTALVRIQWLYTSLTCLN